VLALVPNVLLTKDRIWIQVHDQEEIEVESIAALTAALAALREDHTVDGSWILSPAANVRYDDMIGAIDAARAAQFPHFSIAGGPA